MTPKQLRAAVAQLAAQGEDADTVVRTLSPRCPSALIATLPRLADRAVQAHRSTP